MKPLFSSLIYIPAATTGSYSKTRKVCLVIANHWTPHQQPLISQTDPSANCRWSGVRCQIIDGKPANSQAVKLKRGKQGGSGSREQQCDHSHLENNRGNEPFSFHSRLDSLFIQRPLTLSRHFSCLLKQVIIWGSHGRGRPRARVGVLQPRKPEVMSNKCGLNRPGLEDRVKKILPWFFFFFGVYSCVEGELLCW